MPERPQFEQKRERRQSCRTGLVRGLVSRFRQLGQVTSGRCASHAARINAVRRAGWGGTFSNENLAAVFRLSVRGGNDPVHRRRRRPSAGLMWHFSKDLPDYSQLQDYEPPVMTRVHASDGSLLAEYANERRLYLPIQAVPKLVINAFLAAEDKNFYEHGGLDFYGIARAAMLYVQNYGSGRRPQGASTITQQVAQELPADQRSVVRRARSRKRCSRCASSAPTRRTRSSSSISTRSISGSAPTASPRPRCSISTSRCTS